MAYQLEVKQSAAKVMRVFSKDIFRRVVAAIDELANDPLPPGCTKLAGYDWLYRIRVGDWRIVYEVNEVEEIVMVLAVKHGREVYRDF